MDKDSVLQQVLNSPQLPTLPTVANQLITLTSREDTTLKDIADLISKDISLSAKVLRVVNSSFYSFPQQISSIHQAVSILGSNAVRSLVLSFSFLHIRGKEKNFFNFKDFWKKSLSLAVISKVILEQVEGANTEEVLVASLLQNLGELVFALTFEEEYEKVLAKSPMAETNNSRYEIETFSIDHAELGYRVARSWGFPENLCLPILYHHQPNKLGIEHREIKNIVAAIYLSGILTQIFYTESPELYHKKFRTQAAALLKLSPEKIEKILSTIHTEIDEASSFFDFKMDSISSVHDILQEANIRLSIINLNYDQINKELVKTKMALEKIREELEEKNTKLENLANIDGLTNVFNHRYFQNTLDREIKRSERRNLDIALIMLDIDHFKHFNDTYGHQTGDFILSEIAQVIQVELREYDTLARYGGEEFTIILPETTAEDAGLVAEKVREIVEKHHFDDGDQSYSIRISLGYTSAKPAASDDFSKSDFIYQADSALYNAKQNGRNQAMEYAPKKKGWF